VTHDLVTSLVTKQNKREFATRHKDILWPRKVRVAEAKKDEALGSLQTRLTPDAAEAGQQRLRLSPRLQAGPADLCR